MHVNILIKVASASGTPINSPGSHSTVLRIYIREKTKVELYAKLEVKITSITEIII